MIARHTPLHGWVLVPHFSNPLFDYCVVSSVPIWCTQSDKCLIRYVAEEGVPLIPNLFNCFSIITYTTLGPNTHHVQLLPFLVHHFQSKAPPPPTSPTGCPSSTAFPACFLCAITSCNAFHTSVLDLPFRETSLCLDERF